MKAEQLRKSILQMAIQGKLVPQDPNDEPASVLLEKIRAEKQKLIKEGRIKKDKVDSVIYKGDDNRYYEKIGKEVKDITDEIDFDLPNGWIFVRLSTIGELSGGFTPKPNELTTCGTIPYFKVADMNTIGNELYLSHTNSFLINSPKKFFARNSIVFPKNGGAVFTNKKRILITDSVVDLNTGVFTPTTIIDFNYAFLLFSTIDFRVHYKGTALPTVNNDFMQSMIFGLPPIEEQVRIVAEIEKYEPLIDEYDKLEKQKSKIDGEIYDKLKKSILQYAIQGKLVPQDPNDEPASELLKRIRAEKKSQLGKKYVDSYIYKGDDNCYYEHIDGKSNDEMIEVPFDLPISWCWAKIPEVTFFQEGPGIMANDFRKSGIPLIRISGMQSHRVSLMGCNYLDPEMVSKKWKHFCLDKGDIVISASASMDKIAEVYDDTVGAIPYTGLIRFKMAPILSKHFFKYFIQSNCYIKQIDDQKSGTTIQHYGPTHLQRMFVPIPPLTEQQRIVDKINEIFAKI